MRRIQNDLLERMAASVAARERDEMAIPSYLHRNPAMRWIAWRRLEIVATFLRETVAAANGDTLRSLMDFGCGTGVLLDEASRHAEQVFGVDIVLEPARMLVDEWRLDRVSLMSPDQARKDIAPHSLDVIIAAEVLEHIEPLDDTLAFFRERLAPGGRLLVSVPTENVLYRLGRRLAGFEGHYHQSNAASIHDEILAAGFTADRIRKIPAPGPFAIYWVVGYRPRR